ncbi:XRE family transcriptional regulator [Roseovarius sp. ZX-A-9]|uniref:XRE family transcriptional regulator n=1 Tax=Roseovarius sp. ZX-A-9 TaxID=3014783 RepID=UPI00232B2334|nr:XRE family transcriptional regulator [Roseovarius sp. ZX-A-9]
MAGTLHTKQYRRLIQELVEIRVKSGLSQATLARHLDRPPSFVAKVELCERRLDAIEFLVWLRAVSNEPETLINAMLRELTETIPR